MLRLISTVLLCIGLLTTTTARSQDAIPPEPFAQLESLLAASDYEGILEQGRVLVDEFRTLAPEGSVEEAKALDFLVQAAYRSRQVMNPEAVVWAERAVQIKETLLGADHPELANSLLHAGNLRTQRYEFTLAIPLFRRAEAILLAAGHAHDEHRGTTLSSLSVAYRRSGDYTRAYECSRQAEAVLEKVHGPEHLSLASPLNNQAVVLTMWGDYSGSARVHRRALAIREKNLGPDHEWVGESANNLGNQLAYLGLYRESLVMQERAVGIFVEKLGEKHPRTLLTRMNLAITYLDMGDAVDAATILEEVLQGMEAVYGPEHPQVCNGLETLASCHLAQGHYQEALDLYRRSLGLREKSQGPDSYDCWDDHSQIGKCQIALGDLDGAVISLEHSLAILRADLEEDNVLLCEMLNRLAELHITREEFPAAAELARHSRELCLRDLDEGHPLLAAATAVHGQALAGLGRRDEALAAALEAEQISRNHLAATMPVLSEHRALQYAGSRVEGLGLALSLLSDGEQGGRVERVWDALIRSRGQVLDHFAARNRNLGGNDSPQVAALRDSSLALREMLANLTLRGPGWEEIEAYRELIRNTRRRLIAAERQLSVISADAGEGPEAGLPDLAQVRRGLPAGAALLAFARQEGGRGAPEYLAFVLPGGQGEAQVFRLGDATAIDRAVAGWRSQVSVGLQFGPAGESASRRLAMNRGFVKVARDPGQRGREYRQIGRQVRHLVWDPVAAALGRADQVFIVAAGSLHLLSFPSLPLDGDRFLVEEPAVLHLLTAEKTLLEADHHDRAPGRLLALGGVDYGEAEGSAQRGGWPEMEFPALPEAGREARLIADMWRQAGWPAELLTLAQPSECAVKGAMAGAQVLHLATHGFFLPGSSSGEGDQAWDNPLARTGLALAGANQWRESPGSGDGILTAQEVAAMDLGTVQWAVLSACDTGLGEVAGRGEGVFGLRRAFALAGARTVIMSLWAVEDEQTCLWMDHLYRARWGEGMNTAQAVRTASLAILAQRRAAGLSDHPYYWAAFLAAGDWR